MFVYTVLLVAQYLQGKSELKIRSDDQFCPAEALGCTFMRNRWSGSSQQFLTEILSYRLYNSQDQSQCHRPNIQGIVSSMQSSLRLLSDYNIPSDTGKYSESRSPVHGSDLNTEGSQAYINRVTENGNQDTKQLDIRLKHDWQF